MGILSKRYPAECAPPTDPERPCTQPRKEKAHEILNVPLFPLFSRRHATLNHDPSAFVSPTLFPLHWVNDATRSDKTEIRAAFPRRIGGERETLCANRSSSPSLDSKPDYFSCLSINNHLLPPLRSRKLNSYDYPSNNFALLLSYYNSQEYHSLREEDDLNPLCRGPLLTSVVEGAR